MYSLTQLPGWEKLVAHRQQNQSLHMRQLFQEDSQRFSGYSLRLPGLLFDYSKNIVTRETMDLLLHLARQCGLDEKISSMFSGKRINVTEKRAVYHVALRNRSNRPMCVDGVDQMPAVNLVLGQMRRFCDRVRSGDWKGYTGRRITDVVNIGIGGSDLGPSMACEALRPFADTCLRAHFVSNVDATHLVETLKKLDPETTLFLVASKTFTTQETLTNAHSARRWFLEAGASESDIARHFVAISTNEQAVKAFGIDPENMFVFWDWVGGRYSLWSSIGLSIALYLGMDRFEELLEGAHVMDEHFRTEPLAGNIPVIMALLGIWHTNFMEYASQVILPYDQYLHRFPAYLQQADMESNGKSVTMDGNRVDYHTGALVWGEPGTNGQHAFFQLLHQGTRIVPADFIASARSQNPLGDHHPILLSNVLAQSRALMMGCTRQEARLALEGQGLEGEALESMVEHKVFEGNRPSNTLLFEEMTPRNLGMLIALYEHKIFVQGAIWNINPFDQWGVELGKKLASEILPQLKGQSKGALSDSSTRGLIDWCMERR